MKNGDLKKDMNIFLRTFRLLNSLDKRYFPIVFIHTILDTARYFITIIFSALVLDELLGARDIGRFMLYVGVIIGSNLALKLACDFMARLMTAKQRIMRHSMQKEISRKITRLDYEYMDSPHLHNLRQRILEYENMTGTIHQITSNIRDVVSSLMQIATSIAITAGVFMAQSSAESSLLAKYVNSPIAIPVMIAGIAVVVLIQLRQTRKIGVYQMEINETSMQINRKGIYLQEELLGNYNYGKDLRMYDTEELMNKNANAFLETFDAFIHKYVNKVFASQTGYILLEGLFNGLIYIYVVLKAYIGAISIGSIMKYVAAIQKLTEGMSSFFVAFALIRVDCQFLKNILELMELPDIKYHGTLPVEKRSDHEYEIEFKNVSFQYPSSDEYVLSAEKPVVQAEYRRKAGGCRHERSGKDHHDQAAVQAV